MSQFTLNAELRDVQGKGASRRLRREGLTPAIVYGGAKNRKPANVVLQQKDIAKITQDETFFSSVIELTIGEKKETVLLVDVQRHPATWTVQHMDFQRVSKSTKIHKKIPLHFLNEDSCVGVKIGGGKIQHTATEIEIECTVANLPSFIEVDLAEVEAGTIVHISDITLPKGVKSAALALGSDHDAAVVSVFVPKGVSEDEEEASTDEEAPAAE